MAPSGNNIDLGLDRGEDFARRFTVLPSNSNQSQRQVLAYGGDDGIISFLSLDFDSSKTPDNSKGKTVKRYDDGGVRAVAISKDGKRVAVGFDDGSTKVYCYDDYDSSSMKIHPFAAAAADNKLKKDKDDDTIFSQDIVLDDDDDEDNSFAGPQFDSPIRDLQFHPSQGEENEYFLAIATEDSLSVVNAASTSTLSERYLRTQAEEHHDQCGIRAVSFEPVNGKWLASLALDGRLCIWDTSITSDPKAWKLVHRETTKCIPRKDVGEIHGADASDRSCRPLWISLSNGEDRKSESNEYFLGTPGKVRLVLRRIVPSHEGDGIQVTLTTSDDDSDSTSNKENDTGESEGGGHIESIVAIAQVGNTSSLLTSGRDGRIVLWNIMNGKVGNPQQLRTNESIPTELILGKRVAFAACADGMCRVLSLPKLQASSVSRDEEESRHHKPSGENSPAKDSNRKLKKKDTADDDDDDDVNFADSNDSEGNGGASNAQVRFVDDEAAEGNDDDDDIGKGLSVSLEGRDEATKDSMEQPGVDDDDMSEDLDLSRFNMNRVAHVPAVSEQPAFSPSSTPLDLSRRFLCWNHMGAITLLRGGDMLNDRNTVDITFTDSGVRRPISFTDNQDFIVGSLGEDGGIFASDLQIDEDEDYDNEDDDIVTGLSERTKAAVSKQRKNQLRRGADGQGQPKGSSIYFHRFETIGSVREKDWYLTLPDGERVLGSACGAGWAAVISR